MTFCGVLTYRLLKHGPNQKMRKEMYRNKVRIMEIPQAEKDSLHNLIHCHG
jgi:hypothetical protein